MLPGMMHGIRNTLVAGCTAAITGLGLISCGPIPNEDALDATTGMWQTKDEAQALGAPPAYLVSAAVSYRNDVNGSTPIRVCGNEENNDQGAAAAGFLALRGGTYSGVTAAQFRQAVVDGSFDVIGSEDECSDDDNRQLAIGRNLHGYVVAADMVNLRKASSSVNAAFTNWLRFLVDDNPAPFECGSAGHTRGPGLTGCHSWRTNNWGPRAGASRTAADIYVKHADPDQADRDWAAADLTTAGGLRSNAWAIYKGFTGDVGAYTAWGDQELNGHYCNTSTLDDQPPINPPNCNKSGPQPNWSGALPEDLRRASTPPPGGCGTVDSHVFGAMEGMATQAVTFRRYFHIVGDDVKAQQVQSSGFGGLQRELDWSNRQDFVCGTNNYVDYPGEDPKEAHIPALIQYVAQTIDYKELGTSTLGRQVSFTSYLFPG